MLSKPNSNKNRVAKHRKLRKKIAGTSERPRLNIYRSLTNVYAQVIDDSIGKTLVSASTLDEEIKGKIKNGGNKEAAHLIGKLVGQRAVEKKITKVVFDRGGYLYHGRVKELADGAREAGLEF